MNNQNNNNFDNSFSNSKKTPPKDLLTLSSTTPKKASINTTNQPNNISVKFIMSNNEFNNINTTIANNQTNNSFINNNQPQIQNNNQQNQNSVFVNNLQPVQPQNQNPQIQPSGKFINDSVENQSSVKNININTNSIFNISNNQNMNLNSNNSTYPNYNNQVNNNQTNEQNKMNMLMGNNIQNANNSNNNTVDNSKMSVVDLMKESYIPLVDLEHKTEKENKIFFGILIGSVAVFIITICIAFFATGNKISFFGGKAYYENKEVVKTDSNQTYVYTLNHYENVGVTSKEQAHEMITKDSNNQKERCAKNVSNYEKTRQLEEKMERNYGITAVNFCEMDYNYLVNLEKQIKKVYQEFPMLKGHITNLSISNPNTFENSGAMAAFNPSSEFIREPVLSDKYTVNKTRIYLNSESFLSIPQLRDTVKSRVNDGWFVPNANEYSIVIHEFGHALSSLAVLRNTSGIDSYLLKNRKNLSKVKTVTGDYNEGILSKTMIEEAMDKYESKYKKRYNSILEFLSQISSYATSTNSKTGELVYDEGIAEAFHDYFVNGNKAKPESVEIVKVLKKYLS